MSDKLFNMPLDWDALLTDEKVIAMSDQAFRAYMHLLRAAWQSDNPASLPDNDNFLSRVSGLGLAAWTQVKDEVSVCFRVSNGRWHQKRMRQVYDSVVFRRNQEKERTKKATLARHGQRNVERDVQRNVNVTDHSESNSKRENENQNESLFASAEAAAKAEAAAERKALFDALAKAEGGDPLQMTGPAKRSLGVALAEIMKAFPGVTPEEIGRRADAYRRLMPSIAVTAQGLAKHWARCVPGASVYPHDKAVPWQRDSHASDHAKGF